MANKTLTLSHREAANPVRLLEDLAGSALRRSAETALATLAAYEGLLESLQRSGSVRASGPLRLSLSDSLVVLSIRRRTIRELGRKSDRDLADLAIPREAIPAIATLSAFTTTLKGVPTSPLKANAAAPSTLKARWEQVRRELFPTEDELADAYLAQAGDIYDLESRMRELERNRRRTAFGWRA